MALVTCAIAGSVSAANLDKSNAEALARYRRAGGPAPEAIPAAGK